MTCTDAVEESLDAALKRAAVAVPEVAVVTLLSAATVHASVAAERRAVRVRQPRRRQRRHAATDSAAAAHRHLVLVALAGRHFPVAQQQCDECYTPHDMCMHRGKNSTTTYMYYVHVHVKAFWKWFEFVLKFTELYQHTKKPVITNTRWQIEGKWASEAVETSTHVSTNTFSSVSTSDAAANGG